MSMTVYPITGAAQSYLKTDNNTAAGSGVAGTGGYPAGATGLGVEIRQERSVTKAGATRVMIKLTGQVPYTVDPNGVANWKVSPATVHMVVTVPKSLSEVLVMEHSGVLTKTAMTAIQWLIANLCAIVQTKSVAALPTVSGSLPMIQGLIGAMPLNLDTGTYGSAS